MVNVGDSFYPAGVTGVNDYVIRQECPLPEGDLCRFAVGSLRDMAAFEIVDAREWSPQVHAHLSPASRARAVALMRLGHLLSLQHPNEKQGALREVWREIVLPLVMQRVFG